MTTGDIKNNMRKLQHELKAVQYINEVDFEKMVIGLSAPFLPILHYVFTEYSCNLSSYFSAKGYDLYAKSDFRFLEIIYKILIQEFGTKPMLTKQQFFSIGYSEMKVIFATKIIFLCRQKHEKITKSLGKKKKRMSTSKKGDNQNNGVTDGNKQNLMNNIQQDDTQFVEDHINRDYNTCLMTQIISPKEYPVKPPKPNPELALSPVKSHNDELEFGSDREENKEEIDSRLLDLTDICDESFVEVIDLDDEKSTTIPEFVITKHSNDERIFKVNEGAGGQVLIGSHLAAGHSLPGNISVTCSKSFKQNEKQCSQCIMNSDEIKKLLQRIEVMENDIHNLVTVNNDLSAKVVLVETKVKIMENDTHEQDCNDKNGRMDESKMFDNLNNDFCQYEGEVSDPNKSLDRRTGYDRIPVPMTDITTSTKTITTEKSYSPIKYTDDDIITKDFRPMRMKDVHNMMNKVILSENKENYDITRKETSGLNVTDYDGEVTKRCGDQYEEYDVHDVFSDSCNVSQIGDEFTEEAVRNVKKRLQETEAMLKNCGGYVVK